MMLSVWLIREDSWIGGIFQKDDCGVFPSFEVLSSPFLMMIHFCGIYLDVAMVVLLCPSLLRFSI